jgi:alpha-tubulin suppressor-like RCC1 family protein
MFRWTRMARAWSAGLVPLLWMSLGAQVAVAAPPVLQSINVTPVSKSISVGQTQYYTATGTFNDGSSRTLGPAIANIATGANNTCMVLASRSVKCWGDNRVGQLGDGTKISSRTPRLVKGISTAKAVAFGKDDYFGYGCALLASGAIKCWGNNNNGQLGDGTRVTALIPTLVSGINSAKGVTAGEFHACGVLTNGTVQCWGAVFGGGLGDGLNSFSNLPVSVAGISTASAVTAGADHSCALLASGGVQCWGDNSFGQLGDGTTNPANTPVTVRGISSATAISAGADFTCALLANGTVQCWGWNVFGQLGDGTNKYNSPVPVTALGIGTAVAISGGGYHACAVLLSGSTRCWGNGGSGQLGNGSTTNSSIPVRVEEFGSPTKLIVPGANHTCALLMDGAMRCWGDNYYGQLGTGDHGEDFTVNLFPANVLRTPGVVWQSSDRANATITYSGLATGRAVGNTTITATTAGFINDNAVLTVK